MKNLKVTILHENTIYDCLVYSNDGEYQNCKIHAFKKDDNLDIENKIYFQNNRINRHHNEITNSHEFSFKLGRLNINDTEFINSESYITISSHYSIIKSIILYEYKDGTYLPKVLEEGKDYVISENNSLSFDKDWEKNKFYLIKDPIYYITDEQIKCDIDKELFIRNVIDVFKQCPDANEFYKGFKNVCDSFFEI